MLVRYAYNLFFAFINHPYYAVGANILIGDKAPARALVEALGSAADALINEDEALQGFSAPSTVLVSGDSTLVIFDASDETTRHAVSKGVLYGAYNNYISDLGVSALWNGYLREPSDSLEGSPGAVFSQSGAALANPPDNLAPPASAFAFVEKGVAKKTLSEEEGLEK